VAVIDYGIIDMANNASTTINSTTAIYGTRVHDNYDADLYFQNTELHNQRHWNQHSSPPLRPPPPFTEKAPTI
jgi:hypothetical protein